MAVDGRLLLSALVMGLSWPAAALAQDAPPPPVRYEGSWARSGQSISVDVSSWGADCGPRPQSSSGGGGGRVSIRQADRELVLSGGVRTERSDGCWSMNPRVRRVSHSQSEGRWRTTCRTSAEDPKFEEGTYTLRATSPDTLVYRESSRYDWRLQADHCIATITLSWSYGRVGGAPPPVAEVPDEPPVPPSPTTSPPPVRCASPGEPARVLLDAGRRRIEAGEQVCLRPRVVDASGCETTATAELQSLDAPLTGNCFEVPVDAPDGQRFRIRATAGTLHAEASLVVQSPDIMGYLAARTEDGAAAPTGQSSPTAAPQAGGLSAEPARPREDPILWLVLVIAAVALLILGVAFVLFRNQRRVPAARAASPRTPPRPVAVPATSPATAHLVCPTCHAEFEEGQFCPHDASRLAAAVDEARPGAVCPRCHRGFDPSVRYCPHDSEELVPYTMHEAMAPRTHRHRGEKGKICPACAARYEIDATFCGKDGSELVLVN
jgi:hypothetical protein